MNLGCNFSVSPSPFGPDFGTLDFGTSDLGTSDLGLRLDNYFSETLSFLLL